MERPAPRVAIVGGGITGLAAAYHLEQAAREEGWSLRGVLVERELRLGGKLYTEVEDGFVVEGGPDSFLATKPWGLQMINELGLEHNLVAPLVQGVHLLHRGRLHRVPEGMVGSVPARLWSLWRAPFLSWKGKLRASLEPLVRRRVGASESLGEFLRRRLGSEAAERLFEPFIAGIYAGDPQEMGLRALFPAMAEGVERYGSLTAAVRAARARTRGNPPVSPFVSLRSGMASLPEAVASKLRAFTMLTGESVVGLTCDRGGREPTFQLSLQGGASLAAHYVILAIPAHQAAALLRAAAPGAASLLERLPSASTGSVNLAFRREAVGHPLNGSGFVVPRGEPSPITACTWSSSKWPGRAPEKWALLRTFVGWAKDDSFMRQDDATLVHQVTESLRPLLGLRGQAERAWVHRWPQAMPQYGVGHLEWVNDLHQALAMCPGVVLAGASYQGIGIPDCIRQGQEVARHIGSLIKQRIASSPETAPVAGKVSPG